MKLFRSCQKKNYSEEINLYTLTIVRYNRDIMRCLLDILTLSKIVFWLNVASFYQVFVGARLHVTGGVLRGGRSVEGEAAIAGNLCFYFITNFFYCTRFLPYCFIHFLLCVYIIYSFLFLFWQYWTLLLGFGWTEMVLCPPHAQTKVMIMTLLWSSCVVVAIQQQLLVFKFISMVVLEEVSNCIMRDENL